jgi:hypothetical protein
MKKRHNGSNLRGKTFWTPQRAHAAMGLLTRLIDDIRDAAIEQKSARQGLTRLDKSQGRPSRQQILRVQTLQEDLNLAQNHAASVLTEAQSLGIEVVDPLQGIAILPCLTSQGMGMLVVDRFAGEPLVGWRLIDDPPNVVRKIPTFTEESRALGLAPSPSAVKPDGTSTSGPESTNHN